MLTGLHIRGFKSLHEVRVGLKPLTVFVGPNGCGKSSVLQALALSRAVQDQTLERIPEEYRTKTHKSEGVLVALDFDDGSLFDLTKAGKWGTSQPSLGFVEFCRLDRYVMERPSYSDELDPVLGPDGANLASVLDALHGEHPDRFDALEDRLRRMVPGFRRLRHPRAKVMYEQKILVGDEYRIVKESKVGHRVVLDFDYAEGVAAEHVSEGTLLLVGLLTILVNKSGPLTLLLDDLDRALHPRAQKQLVEHLRQLIAEREGLQILATSHSPYLVEHLEYEEVLAMTQSPEDGRSYIAPLLDHPDAERWREEMSAGEFWSSVGEDWVRESKAG